MTIIAGCASCNGSRTMNEVESIVQMSEGIVGGRSLKNVRRTHHPELLTHPVKQLHLGSIVRAFRMKNDIGEQQFAATVRRSISWLQKFEKKGSCFERTRKYIYEKYPAIQQMTAEVGVL